jgi:hypothetical protein
MNDSDSSQEDEPTERSSLIHYSNRTMDNTTLRHDADGSSQVRQRNSERTEVCLSLLVNLRKF